MSAYKTDDENLNEAIMETFEKLPPAERERIERMAENLIIKLRAMRYERGRKVALGLGINGAIELLGKLGIWILQNDKIMDYN